MNRHQFHCTIIYGKDEPLNKTQERNYRAMREKFIIIISAETSSARSSRDNHHYHRARLPATARAATVSAPGNNRVWSTSTSHLLGASRAAMPLYARITVSRIRKEYQILIN
jgi:hypothetical protein